jgi:hypothetical protein
MLRTIHFLNIKPDADTERMLSLLDEVAAYSKTFGCIERKTWKVLDSHTWQPERQETAPLATYMNESLWPSQREADTFSQAHTSDEWKRIWDESSNGIEFVLTLRYVDSEG